MSNSEIVEAKIVETPESELRILRMTPGSEIVSNADSVKAYIDIQLEHFSGDIEISSNADYKEAKSIRAGLNSIASGINGAKRQAKKVYMAPYETFAAKLDELTQPVKDVSAKVDEKVKAYELMRDNEKRKELIEHYEEIAPALIDIVPFSKLEAGTKWMNLTCKIHQAKTELESKVLEISKGEETIKSLKMDADIEADTLAFFFDTLDFSEAAIKANELKARKAQLAELEKQRSEWTNNQEASEPIAEPDPQPEQISVPEASSSTEILENQDSLQETSTWYLCFNGTTEQAKKVGAALKSLGMTGKITKDINKLMEA